jgi:hypothetical protein
LAIRSFKADLPAAAVGDTVVLSWDVTKGAQVSIDQGVGDVTAQTVSGVGSIEVPITTSRTFTLTLSRGAESLTASVSVAAIDGIAAGWRLIDNFDRYQPGLLNQQGGWADLDAVDWEVVEDAGNKYAVPNAGGATARLLLGRLTMVEGDERTLFFRVKWTGDEFEPVGLEVALTDRAVRFGTDTGNDIGPGAVISTEPGFHLVGGYNGWQGSLDFGPMDPVLEADTLYNVWVDIRNGPFDVDPVDPSFVYSTGDIYSIHVQKDGDPTRSTIISGYVASRNPVGQADIGFTRPNLDKLIIGTLGTQSTTRNVFIDDIYLSKSGYNATVPRAAGFTEPVGGGGGSTPTLAIGLSGTQIRISFSGGTLESSDSLTGGWAPVAGATSPYLVTPDAPKRFYRVRQ